MLVKKYEKEDAISWNEFVKKARNSTFMLHRDYIEYHSNRFEDYSLMIFDDKDNLVGLLPANRSVDNLVISHQGLTYGGLVLNVGTTLKQAAKILCELLRFLHINEIELLTLKVLPSFYSAYSNDDLLYLIFLLQGMRYRLDTAIAVDTSLELPCQERRIRAIKKARKLGVEIVEEESFAGFWNDILIPNLRSRFGVTPVHSLREIEYLASRFPANIRQFSAYLDGRICAGTTIYDTGRVAHAQYISADSRGKDSGAIDLLFQSLIFDKFSSHTVFDFGICNEEEGKKINTGLLEWKEGFGGRTYLHEFYKIETKSYSVLEEKFNGN
ncbi:GNAT family N-acetyltransferase [Pedobacter sp. SYSU D00535]|uniref:GNAT family N-acetyltransferase n=1 Tax=Pedobacter sp. SYSU D00535 TaxID=2810308 RepID=UPI001A9666F8|nr:GNAT family N-acetyltransferase [Pedobacter sp. SYSU D00535]